MSQRNPMNERYTTDTKAGGKSRKSAASAKPKSAAAGSVVQGVKSKKTKKAASDNRSKRKEQREKEYQAEQRYGDPPWKKFKIMKKLWIACLAGSIISVALAFGLGKVEDMPEWLNTACLISAYVFIAATLYIDLGQIRRMRKKWVAYMSSTQTKEGRAEQKRLKAEQREAEKKAAEEAAKKAEEDKSSDKSNSTFIDKVKEFFTVKK